MSQYFRLALTRQPTMTNYGQYRSHVCGFYYTIEVDDGLVRTYLLQAKVDAQTTMLATAIWYLPREICGIVMSIYGVNVLTPRMSAHYDMKSNHVTTLTRPHDLPKTADPMSSSYKDRKVMIKPGRC
jgi:hypothetical protein